MKARRRKLLFIFCTVGSLFALLLAGTHLYLKRRVSQWKSRLTAQGERLEIKDCLPPDVDARDNAFGEVSRLTSRLAGRTALYETAPPSLLQLAPGKAVPVLALTNWISRRSGRQNGGTNGTWSVLTAELADATNALTELAAVLREAPPLDANLDYHQGFTLLLPHLSRFKGAVQSLQAAALNDLRASRRDQAMDDLCAILALVRGTEHERLFISQLVRIAMAQIAFNTTWQFLQAPDWRDPQLARLQASWQKLEFIAAAEGAICMERAVASATAEAYRASHGKFFSDMQAFSSWPGAATSGTNFSSVLQELPERTWQGLQHFVWRWWGSYVDELGMLQLEQVWIETARLARSSGSFAAARSNEVIRLKAVTGRQLADAEDGLGAPARLESLFVNNAWSLQKAPLQAARAETLRNLAVAAVAIKRFQQQHGKLPPELASVTPDLVAQVPRDPMDGRPLRYRLMANGGFLLYSVGEDGNDDQGDPVATASYSSATISWTKGRDWVWPQPATEEEVREYNLEQEKRKARSVRRGRIANSQ